MEQRVTRQDVEDRAVGGPPLRVVAIGTSPSQNWIIGSRVVKTSIYGISMGAL